MAAGGAIAAWTGSQVFIQKSVLVAPKATAGGAIFLYAAADAIVEASRINQASAEYRGGCVYMHESAIFALNGSHFDGCTAIAGGGGFFSQHLSLLQITESVVERCFAFVGGVSLAYGSVYAANSSFRDSSAASYCGGIFMTGSSTSFVGEDLILRSLTSASATAAVLIVTFGNAPVSLSMRRVYIENCYAQLGGSVLTYGSIMDLEEVVITHSRGLRIDGSTATIVRSVVANCTETEEGGCMWTSSSVVKMLESRLRSCTAPRGGAIFSARESQLVMRAVVIADSVATEGSGGAALLLGSSVLDAEGVTFANCTAGDDGGAISVIEDGRVSFGGASVMEGNVAAGRGGAVSVRASTLYLAPRCSFVVLISVETTRVFRT